MPDDCCPNCEALLHGLYCSSCGQRQPRPDEYSAFGFLVDAATEIFSVDGKTIRTVRQLFRHPGRLALDYYQGRRNQYLKPIQLFIIVNVLFLLFAVGFGFFDFTLGDYMESSAPFIRELANQKINQKGVGFESYAAAFNLCPGPPGHAGEGLHLPRRRLGASEGLPCRALLRDASDHVRLES